MFFAGSGAGGEKPGVCTALVQQGIGVHWNRYCKIRPEPELGGTDERFRPELLTGTGTDFINLIIM